MLKQGSAIRKLSAPSQQRETRIRNSKALGAEPAAVGARGPSGARIGDRSSFERASGAMSAEGRAEKRQVLPARVRPGGVFSKFRQSKRGVLYWIVQHNSMSAPSQAKLHVCICVYMYILYYIIYHIYIYIYIYIFMYIHIYIEIYREIIYIYVYTHYIYIYISLKHGDRGPDSGWGREEPTSYARVFPCRSSNPSAVMEKHRNHHIASFIPVLAENRSLKPKRRLTM